MDWIEAISSEGIFSNNSSQTLNKPIEITPLNLTEAKSSYSVISQFFLAITASSQENCINLSVLSEKIYLKAIEHLATHFQDVKVALSLGEPTALIIKNVKDNSIRLLQNDIECNRTHPIIMDLFSPPYPSGNEYYYPNKSVYKVQNSKLANYVSNDFEEAWDFIQECYKEEDDLIITPNNMFLTEDLKNSISIRYFASKLKSVFIWVNNDNNKVIYLHLKLKSSIT